MLMHQGIGRDTFNEMPDTKAVHALYECGGSVTWARKIAAARPFADHDALFRYADNELFALSEESLDEVLIAYPPLGRRPGSSRSHAEQCAIRDETPGMMAALRAAAHRYEHHFGHRFVMHLCGQDGASVLRAISDRMHHDVDTERKVTRNELAKINRTRLERMLGPEGGYDNW
ncbi:2-oxo-4-hydroxy-4-carboxy-5-ureidoimidazoline decarboxylase [Mycobacteroides chelonae]|uniref:2-oxo-4-hydroxy-4-carboxy-5-ureidoimidazoline decarboxylase n=1 Tax=Mycobacteroides chelonae TaxID=1774 RepID=UPI0009936C54|nr:2-oxo-4-hydroxy-4-carboxy-5-ureidoimidazoline decarboxylase [Mycobacteroides chelonae]